MKFLTLAVLLCMMNWENLLAFGRFGEQGKTTGSDSARSEFEVDYDLIIFSSPFRNLQDKTQVFPLPEQAFVHTRLTHSLEVSSLWADLWARQREKFYSRSTPN